MKKNIRFYYLKFLTFVISTIALILGFTNKIIAQYGAPVVEFFVKGNVYAENNKQPLPDIYLGQNYKQDSVFTDQNGEFAFKKQAFLMKEYPISADDVDSSKNGEYFRAVKYVKRADTIKIDFYLKRKYNLNEIIEQADLPKIAGNEKIEYVDVIYLSEKKWNILVKPLNYKPLGCVFFNQNKLLDNEKFKTEMNFKINPTQEINYFYIEIPEDIDFENKKRFSQKVIFSDGFDEYEFELTQICNEKIQGLIIITK